MKYGTIAWGVLLVALCVYGKEKPLARSASDFESKSVGLTETLLRFAHQEDFRVAIEYVDRASMEQPIAVSVKGKTIGQGIDSILQKGSGYRWRLRNGIVEITNRHVSKRAETQLNVVIPVFKIPESQRVKMTSVSLWWELQLRLHPAVGGYGGDIMEGTEASTVRPAELRKRTVREILAYIVVNSRAEGWIVAGPPECLGFTPHCGLWKMIEVVPSAPSYSYEALLKEIHGNL
jgi:hypothetical protein